MAESLRLLLPSGLVVVFPSVLLLPVCSACQVSVTVRLACLGRTSATRDTGHHSRFVPQFSLPACPTRGVGIDGGFLLEQAIELSHDPRLGGARVARRSEGARQDGRMDEPHCTVVDDVMRQNGSSLSLVTW